jgi:hypothetical protein
MPLYTFQKLIKFYIEYTTLYSLVGMIIKEKLYMFLYIIRQEALSRGYQEAF